MCYTKRNTNCGKHCCVNNLYETKEQQFNTSHGYIRKDVSFET